MVHLTPLALDLTLRGRAETARFDRRCRDPQAVQGAVLRRLLIRNASTKFGQEHRFTSITGPAQYASQIPVREYEALRPWVDQAAAGTPDVLTADPVMMFTRTSGTTGTPKLIPVTERWRGELSRLNRRWMTHAVTDHPSCFDGTALVLAGSAVEGQTTGGLPYGAMSGLTAQRIPRLARRHVAVPNEIHAIHDHELRILTILRLTLTQPVSFLAAPNPRSLERLAEVAAEHGEELIRAIRDGTPAQLPPSLRSGLRPDPAAARRLDTVAEQHGTLVLGACWPRLALVGCWLGGTTGRHATRLPRWYGEQTPQRDLGLLASEGRLTVPVQDGTAAGVLAIDTAFFEFVPEQDLEPGAPKPPVRLAHELTDGHRYGVVITGSNGLWRYDLNDVVEVCGFHGRTPKLAFVRKGRDMLNITGEKLHLNHVQAALGAAERRSGLQVLQFQLVAQPDDNRYDLLVELEEPAVTRDPRMLITAFDSALMEQNLEYASKRASGRLEPPVLHLMRDGWAERRCQAAFAAGRQEQQYKWPALRDGWDPASRPEVRTTIDTAPQPHRKPHA